MAKRWKVSDIVRAALGDDDAGYVERAFSAYGWDLAEGLERLDATLPLACGVPEDDWLDMTDGQRYDALVATARRLNVPRRA